MKLSHFALLALSIVAYIGGVFTSAAKGQSAPPKESITEAQMFSFEYPKDPTPSQAQLLGMAYDIANKDGLEHPQLLQGIILQESHAGTLKRYNVVGQEYGLKPTKRYYGVSQIKLSATWDVMKKWPALWTKFRFHTRTDDELIAKLIEDDVFNMTIASKYLLILRDTYGFSSAAQLAMAYNKGPGGAEGQDAETNDYAQAVLVKTIAH